jgi:hypothetical protein
MPRLPFQFLALSVDLDQKLSDFIDRFSGNQTGLTKHRPMESLLYRGRMEKRAARALG